MKSIPTPDRKAEAQSSEKTLKTRSSMTAKNAREEAARDFFSKSTDDLASAKVLYDTKHFSNSLYFLQQSGEKLAKALWLSIGILTPKRAREDRVVRDWMGFQPKEPIQYGHRILPHLVSDLDKMIPSMQEMMGFVENSELGPRVSNFLDAFRRSAKSVKKLKKKPLAPAKSTEQLEKEVKAVEAILDSLDQNSEKMNGELGRLDITEIVQVASGLVRRVGFRVNNTQVLSELPSFDKLKTGIVQIFRLSVLALLSAAIASLLDPLESSTRYPDSQHGFFDENHPYVQNFMGLYDAISCLLQKSRQEISGLKE